jgi:DNA-binding GntR family transcriptional regulator
LTDQVVTAIRDAVHAGELQPGQLYSAYQIADLLEVSRAPVREALMKLSEAGMVRMERNRGFRLVVPEPHEIAEIFHLRLLLEVPAARIAAERSSASTLKVLERDLDRMRRAASKHDEETFMSHDRDFHETVLHDTGNARLFRVVTSLRDATRTLGASTVDRSRSLNDIADEHTPILEAIRAGDADAAARAMAGHVVHTGRLLLRQAVSENGGDPDDADALWDEIVGETPLRRARRTPQADNPPKR